MTAPRRFSVKKKTAEPTPFEIELEQEDGSTKVEVFHAKPVVPGSLILDLVASGSVGTEYQAAAIRQFFHRCIVDDEVERFLDLLDNSQPEIEMDQLTEIANYLIEMYSNRPTSSASPS